MPKPRQSEHSIVLSVEADVYAEKLVELSLIYKQMNGRDIDLENLLVLNSIYTGQKITFAELEKQPFVNQYQLRKILAELQELEFIETTGKTSGQKYIIHRSKLETTDDKISYSKQKRQEKALQKEAILRYLDDIEDIDNEGARLLLKLPDKDISVVSRLFAELKDAGLISERRKDNRKIWYERKRES